MPHTVTIRNIKQITHDVKQYRIDKPANYTFIPGQATEVSIDKEGWRDEKRPFTFTSLNEEPDLEFTIKSYRDHNGVTNELDKLHMGDRLIIDDPWGAIRYEGPGVFLAGGAGITPFIAILRMLHQDDELEGNRLIFSNKSEEDIILHDEFEAMFGPAFLNTLPEQDKSEKYLTDLIDQDFLEKHIDDFDQNFYVCGPPRFVEDIKRHLQNLGASPEALVFEK